MDNANSDEKALKRWFFIDKRVGYNFKIPCETLRKLIQMDLKSNCKSSSPSAAAFSKKKPNSRNMDDGPANGKIDATESSPPTRKKFRMNPIKDHAQEEAVPKYKLWMFKYPSALTSFEHMTNHAKGKKIALFLDYDGTLSPIVNHPDSAFMSNEMRTAVKSVAEYFPTAIISGRSRDKVFELVGLTELYYAGSHGMDMMGPVRDSKFVVNDHQNCIRTTDMQQGKESQLFQPATEFLPTINEVFRSLVESTGGIKGAVVENNKFTVAVHYRQVEKKAWLDVAQIVQDTLKEYPNLKLTRGRKVLEIRPVIDWNKGNAVEFLLQSLDLGNSEDVLPIFIGDDRTDEDAFKVLREKTRGYGIVVSSVPKESSAFYSLRDPSEVLVFLRYLVSWGGSNSIHPK